MRVITAVLFLLGMFVVPNFSEACKTDMDCKGIRICTNNVCVSPGETAPLSSVVTPESSGVEAVSKEASDKPIVCVKDSQCPSGIYCVSGECDVFTKNPSEQTKVETPAVIPVTAPLPVAQPIEVQWFVRERGILTGPFTKSIINGKMKAGAITNNALINQVNTPTWVPVSSVFGGLSVVAAPRVTDSETIKYVPSQRPSTGIGGVVVGSILLGLGIVNLASTGICFADFYPAAAKDQCVALSLGFGGALTVVGIATLVAGKVRRRRYKAWRRTHSALNNFSLSFNSNSSGLFWTAQF